MKVVDNSPILNYPSLGDDSAFIAATTYAFVNSTKVITITDTSTTPSGGTFKRVNIEFFDKAGKRVTKSITSAGGTATADLDGADAMDISRPISIKAATVWTNGVVKDGLVWEFMADKDASGSFTYEK